tara:strand:- start:619 stop:1260 length:642 start_codon:yes stop_codon:yes gene_type:complete
MYLLRSNEEINPVYCVHDFLSDKEIEKIIEYTQCLTPQSGKVGGISKNKKNNFIDYNFDDAKVGTIANLRKCIVKWIKLDANTNWLYKKVISQIHDANQKNFCYILKYIEDIQFTEYNDCQKGFHSEHYDCGDKKDLNNFVDVRKLSFSIQLSSPDDYEGGELILYKNDKEIIAPKEKGTIIFFESDISHKVNEVKKGTRYSLVGWVKGPNLR